MKGLLYFIVIVLANTVGAVSGMGGGVIIKPVFDFVAADSVATISFYSTLAVFVMSIVSTARQLQAGNSLSISKLLYLALGSALGGALGSLSFDYLLSLTNDTTTQLTQIILTIAVLVWSLVASYDLFRNYRLERWYYYVMAGGMLGLLASFLGIGGGPINVSLLMLLFALPIKEATMYSIGIIFFSQLTKILSLVFVTRFTEFEWFVLPFIIVAAIVGGVLGAHLSKILSSEKVTTIFRCVIVLVLLLNLYNGYRLF